jgi:hypothetical protein
MNVRQFGPLLCLALAAAPSPAQAPPPATAKPPAQPPLAPPAPLPPPIVDEPAEPLPVEVKEPASGAEKTLWCHGDGGEYLLWYIKNSRVPALLVTPGAGAGTSRVLYGDSTVEMLDRSGGLFTLSVPLNTEHTIGFHGTYFFLGSREVSFWAGGNGGPDSLTVGRPYIDAATGTEAARPVSGPGVADGAAHVLLTSRLQGVEANGVANALGGEHYQVDLLAGFRFLQLAEGLSVIEREAYLAGAGDLAGTTFLGEDHIAANTRFYGGQVGTRLEFRRAGAFLNVTGKVAFGDSVEVVHYGGTSVVGGPGGTEVARTGNLFALPSNVGRYPHETFALLPELTFRVGYAMGSQARVFVGYSLVYLSDVVRPGDQIDPVVNAALMPGAGGGSGPNRPGAPLHTTDFWA